MQLGKVTVRVENILRGDIGATVVPVYYLISTRSMGHVRMGMEGRGGKWRIGDRAIFFLHRDSGELRTIFDTWAFATPPVLTGAHPDYKPQPNESIANSIIDILLDRGQGCDNTQSAHAILVSRTDTFDLAYTGAHSEVPGLPALSSMVNDLDNKAVAAGESDPYKFAQPFQRAQLESNNLDALRKEAKALNSDLAKYDEKAKAVIAEYRRTAQNAAARGLALPPAPPEIYQLQTIRTAILVQHMVSLQSALGPEKTAQLDAYLGREFVPHMSLKPLTHPAASTVSGVPAQPFSLGHQ
jgi:hypothetical protein